MIDTTKVFFHFASKANGYLSNFFPASFKEGEKVYPTTQHYFQSQKWTSSPDFLDQIRLSKSPQDA